RTRLRFAMVCLQVPVWSKRSGAAPATRQKGLHIVRGPCEPPPSAPRGAPIDRFRKNAILLWSGQFVSQMGDAVFMGAVAWLAATLRSDATWTGVAVFAGAVPFLLLGPLAGAWVDRGDRRRIMVVSDVVRAALLLSMP